jgi:DNA-binding response OmpR family regulator
MPLSPVTLAVDEGAPPPTADVLAVLATEAIEVATIALAYALGSEPQGCEVLVVWAPRGLDARTCERVVAWGRGRTPPVGLVAWSEDTERRAAERALAAGFDDAQTGPCSPRELAVRIRALQRRVHRDATRGPARPGGRLRYGEFVLDPDTCELWLDRRPVSLTITELHAMIALLRARGAVLTRGELLDRAWGGDQLGVGERAVDNVILRLRRKLGRPALIQTVRGVGFRLDVDGADAGAGTGASASPSE